MEDVIGKEAMRFLIEAATDIDRALCMLERNPGSLKTKKYLEDIKFDLQATLNDAKDICRNEISKIRQTA